MRKKIVVAGITCFGFMLSINSIKSQNISDFENLILATDTFWEGADLNGTHSGTRFTSSFTSGDAIFPNIFDTAFGFPLWTQGFAYSNKTDSVTSGVTNKHSARSGSGVNGSSNYVVGVQDVFNGIDPVIRLSPSALNTTVSGVYITNGTYAANSMRDGDMFAKKFGGTSGNDPDWFKLTIKGFSGGNLTSDSVDFYLADFRSANNTQDYIVTTWEWVDLTSLGNIDSLKFTLSSSDVGMFGMNTPAYFCLDNFNDQTVSIEEKQSMTLNLSVYPNPISETLFVELKENINFLTIVDATGKTVLHENELSEGNYQFDISYLESGIYFLKASSKNSSRVERLIKQ